MLKSEEVNTEDVSIDDLVSVLRDFLDETFHLSGCGYVLAVLEPSRKGLSLVSSMSLDRTARMMRVVAENLENDAETTRADAALPEAS